MDTEKLLELKEKIETAKTKVSQLKGKRDYLLQQLKTDWQCKTLKEAEQKEKELEIEIANIEEKIEKGLKELNDNYDFD